MSNAQPLRLATGGRLAREQPVSFYFNSTCYAGYQGDTLASALLANGVRVVGRSFKYHRPRGILSAGAEECNALVTVGRGALEEPNVRATLQPLYDGLVARSQNCWPGVGFDLARTFDYLHFLWPAGFYNKTFIWPGWRWYEGFIRRLAGLGRLPPAVDPDAYERRNAHCDVLIVGGGAAGLSAALAASEHAARVIVLEQDRAPGGSLLWSDARVDGRPEGAWLEDAVQALRQRDNVTLLTGTTAVAWFDHHLVVAEQRLREQRATGAGAGPRQCLWKLQAREVVLATGAIEQPLLFANNDRPGVMLASAVQQYCNRYAVAAGKRIAIATNNDSAYGVADALLRAGVEIVAMIDARRELLGAPARNMRDQGLTVFQDAIPLDCRGDKGVRSLSVARRGSAQTLATLQCDCVALAGGWQPTVHLFTQARGRLRHDAGFGAFVPDVIPPRVHVAGLLAGVMSLDLALQQGREAGLKAVGRKPVKRRRSTGADADLRLERASCGRHRPERQWIDFQHDVTLRDIDIATAENYTSVEHVKRYTTAGMSVDQGKTANLNALLALAERRGCTPDEVGVTTFRPFYLPVSLGTLAGCDKGEFYAPERRSPLFVCHQQAQARFDDYAGWRRPRVYLRAGEDEQQAIAREARAARNGVVLFDGSPLGKFEVHGDDAAEFLNRVYINNVRSLKTSRARYGLMLNENGVVIDDGVFARISARGYLLHTTSGAAERIHAWLEALLQGDWPQLDVLLTPVSSQWANIAVSGPRARELVQRLETGLDLSADGLPHTGFVHGALDGIPLRVLRVSFTGELCYELSVPASWGTDLWQRLLRLGEDLQVMPIGVETLMVLRTEKGYLHIGVDTDGASTPRDLGWGRVAERKSEEFLGKRSLTRPANLRAGRLELVGLAPVAQEDVLVAGTHVIDSQCRTAPAPTQGYVTSACYSPNLQRYVGLGLVRDGMSRRGETVNLYDNGAVSPARICAPTAWDPQGERLHV